jgi:transcriptional regulator with XRE-family HTH domain
MTRASFAERLRRDARDRRKEVGRILRSARNQQGLRQWLVGEALGYGEKSQGEVSRIEAGKRNMDVVELENFARLYGLKLRDFETWDKQQVKDRSKFTNLGFGSGSQERLGENEFQERLGEIRRKAGKSRRVRDQFRGAGSSEPGQST